MTLSTILAFVTVAALLVISPGPNGVLIAKTVPTSGKLAGFANVTGFVTAFYIHGAFVLFGLSVILLKSAELFFLVKMLGAAYLCYVGIKALVQAWHGHVVDRAIAPARRRRTLAKAYVEACSPMPSIRRCQCSISPPSRNSCRRITPRRQTSSCSCSCIR